MKDWEVRGMDGAYAEAGRQEWRYRFADGLVEVMLGVAFVASGASLALGITVAAPLVMAALILLRRPLLDHARRRLTYPRLGYLVPRGLSLGEWVLGFLVGVLLSAFLIVVPGSTLTAWLPAVAGLMGAPVAACLAYGARRTGAPRLLALAITSLGLGILLSITTVLGSTDALVGVITYLVLMGVLLLASGGWAFTRLARRPVDASALDA